MASYKITDALFLTNQAVANVQAAAPVAVESPTDHIVIIDCSGSMSWELPKIREQLKRKIPKTLKEADTLSIIWFSSRGEFGCLLEAEPVATLKDLKMVDQAIDRWLRPVGLTGFKDPLVETPKLVDRLAKKLGAGRAVNLFFMSDGCDNQWPRADILKAVEAISGKVSSATFVEYGYYADRPLLTQMAEKCGGTLIFAETFDTYAPTFEAAMAKKVSGAPKIEVQIKGDVVGGFVYHMADGDLITYAIEGGAVRVPEDTGQLWFLTSKPDGKAETFAHSNPILAGAAYAALSLYAQRMNSNVVFALLKATGDVKYIEQFTNCFGKQKYSEFTDSAKVAAFDASLRLTKGYAPDLVPAEDAFTVLDLLRVLASDDSNRILLDSEDFKYSKMSRGRVDANTVLTAEEQEEVSKLTEELTKTKDAKKVTELTQKIAAISNKPDALKFEADKQPDGYAISTLGYNEDRPNINFLVRKTGTVDISARNPDAKLPTKFPSFIFRNYNVIKDGLVGLDRLPVRLTAGTIRDLKKAGMSFDCIQNPKGETLEETQTRVKKASDDRDVNVVFDLKALPIINRKMVKEVSAKVLFETEWELTKARAAQKVFNTFLKEQAPEKSKGFVEQYGQEAADWLKEQGFTEHSGFAPKQVQAEAKDVYMGKVLEVKVKGFSALPSLNEAKKKLASGKPNATTLLMKPYIDEVEGFIASPEHNKAPDPKKALVAWLEAKKSEWTKKTRELIATMAQIKFSIVVGQVWPVEFKSLDENQMDLTLDGQKLSFTLEASEEEIKI